MKRFLFIVSIPILFFSYKLTEKNWMSIFPNDWPAPQYDFSKNPLTQEKIDLGRALFYEGMLSRDGTISCASCHSQYSAFTHTDHDLSHGIDDRIGKRNSPTLMNLAWQDKFMWDGSVHHLDVQGMSPIHNPLEMDDSLALVVKELQNFKIYRELYYKAYGDSTVTGERTLKALSQFMLTMVSSNSKYDKIKRKEPGFSFSQQEQNGYNLFLTNCASCHKEPLFTTNGFANNGLPIDTTLNDYGRYVITNRTMDSLTFKIPTLRNIEFSKPYMHDGRFETLKEVLDHYEHGIQYSSTLNFNLIKKIELSSNEKVDLLSFLLTLTDKEFLFNRDFNYPKEILKE